MFQQSLSNEGIFNLIGFLPKQDMFVPSLTKLFDEYDRFVTFGATESELERMRQAYLTSIEQNYQNKDKILSADYTNAIVSQVLTNNTVLSPEDNYKLQKNTTCM